MLAIGDNTKFNRYMINNPSINPNNIPPNLFNCLSTGVFKTNEKSPKNIFINLFVIQKIKAIAKRLMIIFINPFEIKFGIKLGFSLFLV